MRLLKEENGIVVTGAKPQMTVMCGYSCIRGVWSDVLMHRNGDSSNHERDYSN